MCWLPALSASAGCFDFSKQNKLPVIDKHYINGRLFLYNKNQRNFSQDSEELVTRFAASCYKISGIPVSLVFLCSFLWAYSSSGGKYAPPEELPQKSFRSFSLSANSLFMGFPAVGLAFQNPSAGYSSFSRHVRSFSRGCVLSGIFGAFPTHLRAFHLPVIWHAEGFFPG